MAQRGIQFRVGIWLGWSAHRLEYGYKQQPIDHHFLQRAELDTRGADKALELPIQIGSED